MTAIAINFGNVIALGLSFAQFNHSPWQLKAIDCPVNFLKMHLQP